MTYRIETTTTEMQCATRHSSHGSSRRHRSKEHKKSEKHIYYLLKNASEKKAWARAERSQMSISGEDLEKELARSREVGKDAETVMSLLPPTQLKHITKLQAELNEQEESSRYEWKVASLGLEKPISGSTPSMWCILHRERKERTEKKERKEKKEKKEKKERTEKVSKSSRHGSKTNDLPALTHEELQQFFTQLYVAPSHTQYNQPSYVQPGGVNSSYYYPAQPAVQEMTSTPSIGGIYSPYASSESSIDSDSHSSGYSSDAESVSSNLTTASTASSRSNSSIVTPPSPRAPLRGILKIKQPSHEVVIQNDAFETSEQDFCYRSIIKNPSAHSYIGTAPHAMKDFTESREKGYLADYQLDTASNVTSSSTSSRKTRFSDEASFCLAYDYYESAEESEEEYYREQEERRRRQRRATEPGALAVSKYVQYGSD